MSQVVAGHTGGHGAEAPGGYGHGHGHGRVPVRIDPAAVTLEAVGVRALSTGLLFVGVVGVVVTVIMGLAMEGGVRHAVAAYHMGFLLSLGMALGSLGVVLVLHATNAGWSATVRRQFENMMSLVPAAGLLFLPVLVVELVWGGVLLGWRSAHAEGDVLAEWKGPFLNTAFFVARAGVYFLVWGLLARRLGGMSLEQDRTGDKWLTARMARMSTYGLVLFALTTAFAGFDWLMGLDYHWYSTMFGVYFFAGNMVSALAVVILVLVWLRSKGKLEGLVTREHFHDLGKLLLAFTVFWAYVTFSQYFLIWYSNIPEETGWFDLRRRNGWQGVGVLLAVGHFIVPFFLLLWRGTKRTIGLLAGVAVWLLLMHAVDVFYVVRPVVYPDRVGLGLLDIAGVVGPVGVFLGLVVRRIASCPLVAVNDPRMHEAVGHTNYV